MPIEYKKLWIMLIQKGITKQQLRQMAELSPATMTKLNKDQYVSMEMLVRICRALECNFGDIIDYIDNK